MKNYGLELEFFVKNKGQIVPAHEFTYHLDGYSALGEIRTSVHDSISRAVFSLKEQMFLQSEALRAKKARMAIIPNHKVDDIFLRRARAHANFVMEKERMEEKSIYGQDLGALRDKGHISASLQINISENNTLNWQKVNEDKSTTNKSTPYSVVFDFYSVIRKLDEAFKEEIKAAGRTAGVFCIKSGVLGYRVEYRSLPNNVNLDKVIRVLSEY